MTCRYYTQIHNNSVVNVGIIFRLIRPHCKILSHVVIALLCNHETFPKQNLISDQNSIRSRGYWRRKVPLFRDRFVVYILLNVSVALILRLNHLKTLLNSFSNEEGCRYYISLKVSRFYGAKFGVSSWPI